eukprot:TRINITY_DN29852_c1_g1_i1.p1 TRINITY_DN29852_c1_g1~~TRINITY_DN29852_c1_g1_i1.p1  ORF type:complete len:878 (+),score=148.63 TRINITY_DN29852_c1_g1_i1:136-2769(+)
MDAKLPRTVRAAYGSMLTVEQPSRTLEQPRPGRSASEPSLQSRVLQYGGQNVMHVRKVQDWDGIKESVRWHQRLASVKPSVSKDQHDREYQKYRKIVNMRQKHVEVVMPGSRPTRSSSSSCPQLLHQQDREQRRCSFEDRLEHMLLRDWDGNEKKYEWNKYVDSSRAAMKAASAAQPRARLTPAADAAGDEDSLGKLLSTAGSAGGRRHLGPVSEEQTQEDEQVGYEQIEEVPTCKADPVGDFCCESATDENLQTPGNATEFNTEQRGNICGVGKQDSPVSVHQDNMLHGAMPEAKGAGSMAHTEVVDVTDPTAGCGKPAASSDVPIDASQHRAGPLQNQEPVARHDAADASLQIPNLQGVGFAGGGPLKAPDFRSILNAAGSDPIKSGPDPVNALSSSTSVAHDSNLLGGGPLKPPDFRSLLNAGGSPSGQGIGSSGNIGTGDGSGSLKAPDFRTALNAGSTPSMLGPSQGGLLGEGARDGRLLKPPDFRSLLNGGSSPSVQGIGTSGIMGMDSGHLKAPDFRTALKAGVSSNQLGSNQGRLPVDGTGDGGVLKPPHFRSLLNAGDGPFDPGTSSSGKADMGGGSGLTAPNDFSSEALKRPEFRNSGKSLGGGLVHPPDFRSILNGGSDLSVSNSLSAHGADGVIQRDVSDHGNPYAGLHSVDISGSGLLKPPDFKSVLSAGSGNDNRGSRNIGHFGSFLSSGVTSSPSPIDNSDGSTGFLRQPAFSSMSHGINEASQKPAPTEIGIGSSNSVNAVDFGNVLHGSGGAATGDSSSIVSAGLDAFDQASTGLRQGLAHGQFATPGILGGEAKKSESSLYAPDGVGMGDNSSTTANEQASYVPSGMGSYVPSGMGSYVPSSMGGASAPRRRRPRAGQL